MVPLVLRGHLPKMDDTDVPLDVRALLAMIGAGEAEDFSLSLSPDDGAALTGTSDGWCYAHEGDHEVHCTLLFTPDEPLLADTRYRLIATATETYQGDPHARLEARFTTGSHELTPPKTAPVAEITAVGPRTQSVEPCDWTGATQVDLHVELAETDPTGRSVLQVFEEADDGTLSNVHTIFIDGSGTSMDFRQVLPPGDEEPRCYRVLQENAAGGASPLSEAVCTDDSAGTTGPTTDTGSSDTSSSDTGPDDPQAGDTAGTADTADEPSEPAAVPPRGCGCAGGPSPWRHWPLLAGLSLLVIRSRAASATNAASRQRSPRGTPCPE